MKRGKVSVVIPAHNAEAFITEAIDSALAQTAAIDLEIVVYNDGSTDGTAEILQSYGDRIVSLPSLSGSRGVSFARNRAMEAATGDLVAFLDADDVWLPDKLEKQIACLREDEDLAVFGMVQEFGADGPLAGYQTCALPVVCLLPTALARRVGGFDESLTLGDFADWLSRLQDLPTRFVYVQEPLARRRHHETNLGRQKKDHRKDYLEVVRRKLARKRSGDSSEA